MKLFYEAMGSHIQNKMLAWLLLSKDVTASVAGVVCCFHKLGSQSVCNLREFHKLL